MVIYPHNETFKLMCALNVQNVGFHTKFQIDKFYVVYILREELSKIQKKFRLHAKIKYSIQCKYLLCVHNGYVRIHHSVTLSLKLIG